MTEPINIPIEMGIKSKANLTLTNTETGEVQTMSMGAPEGMILDHYLDWAMQQGLGLLGETTFNRCYLGTGDTPVQPTDTGLSGSQLAVSSDSVLTKDLTDVNQKFELLGVNESFGLVNQQGLAVTPDENILVVAAAGETSSVDGIRIFLIDHSTGDLNQIDSPEFDDLRDANCRAVSCGGDYLVVGLSQAPWGKLYRRSGNNFIFISDVPQLVDSFHRSAISEDGSYMILSSGLVYKIDEEGIDYIKSVGTFSSSAARGLGFIDEHTFFAVSYSSFTGTLRIYNINQDLVSQIYSHKMREWGDPGDAIYFEGRIYTETTGSGSSSIYRRVYVYEKNLNGDWDISTYYTPPPYIGNQTRMAVLDHIPLLFSEGAPVYYLPERSLDRNLAYAAISNESNNNGNNSNIAVVPSANLVYLRRHSENGPSSLMVYRLRDEFNRHQSYARKWTFPAGTGTGVVNEVVVRATSGIGYDGNNRYFLRFVLPEGFEKTDLHQLEVEVEAEIENPGVWEGVIPEGSRDGSDVSYRITMSENQFRSFITTGYNNLSTWFGTSGTPRVRIGTSNEDTYLVLDRENIRGEEIEYIYSSAIREVISYVPGSLERTIRLFLEINQGNGKIGEIVFGDRFCRVTFDPPLNKYDPEGVDEGRDPSNRLYMNLVFGWKREGE